MAGLVAAVNVNTHPLHDTATPDQELAVAAALYPVLASVCNHRSVLCSAANRSIGSTTGFHNHGEGPYKGLLLVKSGYYRFHI